MKKIHIFFWSTLSRNDLGFKHNEMLPYSNTLRNHIIDTMLGDGLGVMIHSFKGENKDTLLIEIDNGKFRQR